MWVRRGVTVWRGPPASSLPRPPRPIPGRWLVPEPPPGRDRPICDAALRRGQFRAPSPPVVAPQAERGFKTSFRKRVSRRALRPPPSPPSPSAARGSLSMADMSSHIEFRAQSVSLSPGSYYSISAMLVPRVFLKRAGSSFGPRSPARHSVPGCRAAATDASCVPYGPHARAPSPLGDVGYSRISVYGACCQARREVILIIII